MVNKSEFNLENVKCAACVGKIQNKLAKIDGIKRVQVNLLDKTLYAEYYNENLDLVVVDKLREIGYGASLEHQDKPSVNLVLSAGLPIAYGFILMFMMVLPMPEWSDNYHRVLSLCNALVVLIVGYFSGKHSLKSGLQGILTLNLNMYSLVFLGASSAWIYSTVIVAVSNFGEALVNQHTYFDSVLIIIGLINLGSHMEEKAKRSTSSAIKNLAQLVPETSLIIVDGVEEQIATSLLKAGHLVKVRPGERVPSDGIIISGAGYIDEAMVNGEPIPIHKKVGDEIISGTINVDGVVTFNVTRVGEKTLLAGIINLVKEAQLSKPDLAKLADQIVKVFIPIILLIAAIISIIWYFIAAENNLYTALTIFMTVLIIACPCSVGLAIPVSLMVGVGRGATKGILIRDPSCLGSVSKLDTLFVDKTGTLTEGKPQVLALNHSQTVTKLEVWSILASSEKNSNHPLAKAIINYTSKLELTSYEVTDFSLINGYGIKFLIGDLSYCAGSASWVKEFAEDKDGLLVDNCFSQVYLARDNLIIARVDIADKLKDDSIEAVKRFKQYGLEVIMLTGDNETSAKVIANECNIEQVYASCSPYDKIRLVEEFQHKGQVVGFVGDGINDAPSLAKADVGIAMGNGSDIALQSAHISLLRNSLIGVSDALLLANKINRNMRENLFGAFIYNSVAVLVAAGALYPWFHVLLNPVIASVAMSLSSLTVIGNALRLRYA